MVKKNRSGEEEAKGEGARKKEMVCYVKVKGEKEGVRKERKREK